MKLSFITTRWLAVALASAFALGCGGGGGDGDDSGGGGGDGEIVLLPSYAYELTSVSTDPVTVVAPIGDAGPQTLILGHTGEGPGIFGIFDVEAGTITIGQGSTLVVNGTEANTSFYRGFGIEITGTWVLQPFGPPTQGAMTAIVGMGPMVTVEVTADGQLQISEMNPFTGEVIDVVVLSFEQLDEVMDSAAPEWQKLGIFAFQVTTEFVPELMLYGVSGFDLVIPELADASPVTVSCDAFSDLGLVPPDPGIPDAGLLTFTWLDDSADGEVGPGDSFDTDMNYCLMVVPPVEDDQIMLDGIYDLNSYTEVVENNTLVRIGYEGTSPAGRPGGIVFSDFRQFEVYDADGPGGSSTATVHLGATINGRVTLVFFEPVN